MSIDAQADVAVADEEVVADGEVADEQPGATLAAPPEERPNTRGSRAATGRPAMPARVQPGAEPQSGAPERRVASLPPDTLRFDGRPVLPPAATLSPELGDGAGGEDAPEHDEPPPKEERDTETRGEPNDEARGEPREPPQLPFDALIQPISQALAQAALPLATMAPLLAGLGSNGDPAPSAGEAEVDRGFGRGADDFRDGDGFAPEDIDDFDADADQGIGGYGPIQATVEGVGRFVRQVLADFGFGTPNGYETRGLGSLVSGTPGLGAAFEGATSEAFRVLARLMGADEETIDNLTSQLQSVINPYAESHVGNRQTLACINDEYCNEIREANGFPEVQRTRLNARSMEHAVRGTEGVLRRKAASNEQTVTRVRGLTAQLPDLADLPDRDWIMSGGNGVPAKYAANFRYALAIAPKYGWDNPRQLRAWWILGDKESDWNPEARPRDKHGRLLSTAYGIGQFLDATWVNYGWQKTSDPRTQVAAMADYIFRRYETPEKALAFHRRNNWY